MRFASSHAKKLAPFKMQIIFTASPFISALICAPSSLILLFTSSSVNITRILSLIFLFSSMYTHFKNVLCLLCYLVCFTDALTDHP